MKVGGIQPGDQNDLRKRINRSVAALVTVLGAGVVGNGVVGYSNSVKANQTTNHVAQLNQQVTDLQTLVNSLNADLGTRITLDQITAAIDMVAPSTVRVEGEVEYLNFWTGETQKGTVTGSGVILIGEHGERFILTNRHVTRDSEIRRDKLKDGVYHIKVYNGSDFEDPVEFDAAPVILSDGTRAHSSPDEHDLALLFIPPDIDLPEGIGVKIRDTEAHPLKVGEPVFAIGNPFGIRDSVTIGSISHTDREAKGLNKNHHIQTDAAINPGNSGGGLFSIRVENGKPIVELVGINTWGVRGGDGVGGSIRADYIQTLLKEWGIDLA